MWSSSLCAQNACQAWLYDLVTKPHFEVFMVVLICLNMVPLLLETNDQSMEAEEFQCFALFAFGLIFIIEFILKVVAFRKHYFTNGWNIIDFVTIIMFILGKFLFDDRFDTLEFKSFTFYSKYKLGFK